jgi:hypothetical protein
MNLAKTNVAAFEWGAPTREGQAGQSTEQSVGALVVEEANRR